MPTVKFDGTGLSWDMLHSDSSELNTKEVKLDEKHFTASLTNAEEDFGDADGWDFKGAEPELQVKHSKVTA